MYELKFLSQRIADEVFAFLTHRLELRKPGEIDYLRTYLGAHGHDALLNAIQTVDKEWRTGIFQGFNAHLELDRKIYTLSRGDIQIKTRLFARAGKVLANLQSDPKKKLELEEFLTQIRETGDFENTLSRKVAEAKKREDLAEERRANRSQQLTQFLPEYWSKDPELIRAEINSELTDHEISLIKRNTVKKWFADNKLRPPSDEQADVIADCSHSLKVVARAGSGKTRTIAQKILFLVHYLKYNPKDVLSLVFNTKASKELHNRIEKYQHEASLPPMGAFHVLTFDSLAWNLVNPSELQILKGESQAKFIKTIVIDALNNEEGLFAKVKRLMLSSFRGDWEKILRGTKSCTQADLDRLRNLLTEQSIDGKQVKSRAEKRIADFLFEHGIPYLYERPFQTDDGTIIRPDFYIPRHKIIIEYYGLRGDEAYEASLAYKQAFWTQRTDVKIIEINPGKICQAGSEHTASRLDDYAYLRSLLSNATSHLNEPLVPTLLPDEDILRFLLDTIKLQFVELVQNAIARIGQMTLTDVELMHLLASYEPSNDDEAVFLELLPTFEAMYRDRLMQENYTDYSQIKKRALQLILDGKTNLVYDQGRKSLDLATLQFVFVDEFQDFSELFRALLLAILHAAPSALVNAVGDDWQMINRFAGSKPELFDQFDQDYPNPRTLFLQTNYRSAGGLVRFCNDIMRANGVNGKPAIPCEHKLHSPYKIACLERDLLQSTPRESIWFKDDQLLAAIFRILKFSHEQCTKDASKEGSRILFSISRSNNPPLRLDQVTLGLPKGYTALQAINTVVDKLTPPGVETLFEAITAHSCKGLEADSVVVLQPRQFPMLHRRAFFLQFFGDTVDNLLQDELNLFYVACTRAKKCLFYLPENRRMSSLFLGSLSVPLADWGDFPCRLKSPTLYTISVQSGTANPGALFSAQEVLQAHGFQFHRPGTIPTRRLVVRKSKEKVLRFLRELMLELSDRDLVYIVSDGLSAEVCRFPSPLTIDDLLANEGQHS